MEIYHFNEKTRSDEEVEDNVRAPLSFVWILYECNGRNYYKLASNKILLSDIFHILKKIYMSFFFIKYSYLKSFEEVKKYITFAIFKVNY